MIYIYVTTIYMTIYIIYIIYIYIYYIYISTLCAFIWKCQITVYSIYIYIYIYILCKNKQINEKHII